MERASALLQRFTHKFNQCIINGPVGSAIRRMRTDQRKHDVTDIHDGGSRRLAPRGAGSSKARARIAEHRRGLVERAEAEAAAVLKLERQVAEAAEQRRVEKEAADRRCAEQAIRERRQALMRDLRDAMAQLAVAPDHALFRYGEIDYTLEDAKLALAWTRHYLRRDADQAAGIHRNARFAELAAINWLGHLYPDAEITDVSRAALDERLLDGGHHPLFVYDLELKDGLQFRRFDVKNTAYGRRDKLVVKRGKPREDVELIATQTVKLDTGYAIRILGHLSSHEIARWRQFEQLINTASGGRVRSAATAPARPKGARNDRRHANVPAWMFHIPDAALRGGQPFSAALRNTERVVQRADPGEIRDAVGLRLHVHPSLRDRWAESAATALQDALLVTIVDDAPRLRHLYLFTLEHFCRRRDHADYDPTVYREAFQGGPPTNARALRLSRNRLAADPRRTPLPLSFWDPDGAYNALLRCIEACAAAGGDLPPIRELVVTSRGTIIANPNDERTRRTLLAYCDGEARGMPCGTLLVFGEVETDANGGRLICRSCRTDPASGDIMAEDSATVQGQRDR